MTIHKADILISVNALLPCRDHIQTVSRARKARGVELKLALLDDLRTIFLHEIPDDAGFV